MSDRRFDSFEEFWPFYVLEHTKPETQALHVAGTALGLTAAAAAVATRNGWLVPLGLAAAYGAAWYSHYRIENNRPASFKYPVYSFLADFKMVGRVVQGRMSDEVRAAQALANQARTIEMS